MRTGLYRPDDFKDNCGFGLIAHVDGQASHRLLETAIESLTCMTHRGGIASDGKTGDGCGLLLQQPDSFLKAEALRLFGTAINAPYAVGQIFLNADVNVAAEQIATIDACLKAEKLVSIGWRDVPIDESVCGDIARANMPIIKQVFIAAEDQAAREFDVALYVARKKIELLYVDDEQFYVCSMSAQVLSYKGLIMPGDIANFYTDLAKPELATAICVFHQRFSTNTLPKWPLAQPFRALAHNGEINTIMGNRNWAAARASKFSTPLLPDLSGLGDLVNTSGSDSSSLDNMLELLTIGGMNIHRAIRTLVPPAWQNVEDMDADLRAFYDYSSMHMEPWDGPAGMVMSDGRYAICMLDRNGLRPARWVRTKDGFLTLASEIGTYGYKPEDVVAKGRVGPGQILSIDTQTGVIRETDEVDNWLKRQHPYKAWLRDGTVNISSGSSRGSYTDLVPAEKFDVFQKYFNVSFEERDQVIRPMVEVGQEATGSMGDDTPMAVLSTKQRSIYDYFRQQFAQVTNPPIDPLREAIVMSLFTCIGSEKNIFDDSKDHAQRIVLNSPVLSPYKFNCLLDENLSAYKAAKIDLCYQADEQSLAAAVAAMVEAALTAVRDGAVLLVLSDRNISADTLAIHSLIATGAVHHALIAKGLRCDANIIVESASARDAHHFATLIGFGATAVYPYLSYSIISDLIGSGEISDDENLAYGKYRKGINKGLLKIMSKMGISTLASYRGAQLFEAVGLASEVVDLCFKGVTSRIQGSCFADLEADQRKLAKLAWTSRKTLPQGGLLKYVHGEEYHAFNPDVITTLQEAVQTDSYGAYKRYAAMVNTRPVATLRDLLGFADRTPIDIDAVEPIEAILRRFDSAGMSLGALSPEAHEALAAAMNRLGCRSNSGEGGEDPARYGTERTSKIKQIASGRFGVTPHYLVAAEVLQIKVAQGAKPGEGGQLPGGKVNSLIAQLRYSVPGVTLISPPPHHDIYSIEDLAQLIFDLKQVNPKAQVSVKLVSEPGVGTIAAGVAKAYADLITISGYDGGTAASPLTSIRYAGSPWELGLAEVHQALRGNGLRGMVQVQTDGGLKTGVDVIKAAILGAESFGFGTAPMVALGCKYLRICHLNNCATGVATQQDYLRDEHFIGTVQMVMNFFTYVAMETRELMAQLGVRTLEELIGQTELLTQKEGNTDKQKNIDLSALLGNDLIDENAPHVCQVDSNKPYDKGLLAERMVTDAIAAIDAGETLSLSYEVTNCDRSIGARLSGEIAKRHGNKGYANSPLKLSLTGTAGQSFGVWNAGGLEMTLEGDANDYVGKGMAGGKLVIYPPKGSEFASHETAIIGNTCLYGATAGTLYAAGIAGERFAVRNSGASAVIEGAGDHCCEYMTGGCITVLGKTGYNFGAGMTGGLAYVLDADGTFVDHVNQELVEFTRITSEAYELSRDHLLGILRDYADQTASEWGQHLSQNFDDYARRFWLIKPKAASVSELIANVRKRAT